MIRCAVNSLGCRTESRNGNPDHYFQYRGIMLESLQAVDFFSGPLCLALNLLDTQPPVLTVSFRNLAYYKSCNFDEDVPVVSSTNSHGGLHLLSCIQCCNLYVYLDQVAYFFLYGPYYSSFRGVKSG